jgi:hypothetical protein
MRRELWPLGSPDLRSIAGDSSSKDDSESTASDARGTTPPFDVVDLVGEANHAALSTKLGADLLGQPVETATFEFVDQAGHGRTW